MSETTKDIIKFVAEAILVLMIFAVLFTEGGIIMGTYDYMQYAEPITLQDGITRAITTANYAPGYFKIKVESSGKPHTLRIEKDADEFYTVSVVPAQASEMKTKFVSTDPHRLFITCDIEDTVESLGNIHAVFVTKEVTDDGCEITFAMSGAGV